MFRRFKNTLERRYISIKIKEQNNLLRELIFFLDKIESRNLMQKSTQVSLNA